MRPHWNPTDPASAKKLNWLSQRGQITSPDGIIEGSHGQFIRSHLSNIMLFQAVEDFTEYDISDDRKAYRGLCVPVYAVDPQSLSSPPEDLDYVAGGLDDDGELPEEGADSVVTLVFSPLALIEKGDRFYGGQVLSSGLWEAISLNSTESSGSGSSGGGGSGEGCCRTNYVKGSVIFSGLEWATEYEVTLGEPFGDVRLTHQGGGTWQSPVLEVSCPESNPDYYRAVLFAVDGVSPGDMELRVMIDSGGGEDGVSSCCEVAPNGFQWSFTNCCLVDPLSGFSLTRNPYGFVAKSCEVGPCKVCVYPVRNYTSSQCLNPDGDPVDVPTLYTAEFSGAGGAADDCYYYDIPALNGTALLNLEQIVSDGHHASRFLEGYTYGGSLAQIACQSPYQPEDRCISFGGGWWKDPESHPFAGLATVAQMHIFIDDSSATSLTYTIVVSECGRHRTSGGSGALGSGRVDGALDTAVFDNLAVFTDSKTWLRADFTPKDLTDWLSEPRELSPCWVRETCTRVTFGGAFPVTSTESTQPPTKLVLTPVV